MKKSNWKAYAFWIVLAEAVGALSGWLTRKGVKIYNATVEQPPLSPAKYCISHRLGDFVCTHGYWGCAGLSGSGIRCPVTQPAAVSCAIGVQFLLEHYLL